MRWIGSILFLFILPSCTLAEFKQEALATSHPIATQVGLAILAKGGNAFDAAIAVSAALAVVEPYGSGLGGGGFYLLHVTHAKEGEQDIVIDGREVAPILATPNNYTKASLENKKAIAFAGIPGEVAAITHIAKNYARLSLAENLKPAIRLARQGFAADPALILALHTFGTRLQESPHSSRIFLDNGQMPALGYKIVQEDLARVLEAIAYEGRKGFYEGKIAEKLVAGVNQLGGDWILEDLKNYQVKIRKPLKANFRNWTITTVPPPSAGGLTILTTLRILDHFEEDPLSASDQIHLIVESFRRAYCDRTRFVSDPDFYKIPEALTTDAHIEQLRDSIHFFKATKTKDLTCEPTSNNGNTTHFSIMDKEGNRVAATLSINDFFGTGLTIPGTGIILNNELADFSFENKNSPNRLESSKRPVSSMSPLFLESSDKLAILGTPGGLRIPSMLLLAILAAEEEQAAKAWLANPRFHLNFTQNIIEYELDAFSKPVKNALLLRGHKLKEVLPYGNMQLVYYDKKNALMSAYSDPRWFGSAVVQTASSSEPLRVN